MSLEAYRRSDLSHYVVVILTRQDGSGVLSDMKMIAMVGLMGMLTVRPHVHSPEPRACARAAPAGRSARQAVAPDQPTKSNSA